MLGMPSRVIVPVIALSVTGALLVATHFWWLRVAPPLADATLADDYAALVRVEAGLDRLERALDEAWFLGDSVAILDAADDLALAVARVRFAERVGAVPMSASLIGRLERRLWAVRQRLASPDGHPGAYAEVQDRLLTLRPAVEAATAEARLAADARREELHAAGVSLLWLSTGLTLALVASLGRLVWVVRAEFRRHDRRLRVVDRVRRRIEHEADHDPLTGLANRRRLEREMAARITAARAEGGIVAVHLLDLDGLKGINDRFGHAAGDEVLRRVAETLHASLRDSDMVGRLAGDEFVIVQNDASADTAAALAQRIAIAMQRPVRLADGTVLVVSTSVGWALLREDGDTPTALLAAADRRLYADKAGTRSPWRVVPAVVQSA